MPIVGAVIGAVWTLVVIRLACARATVSDRALLFHLLIGAFLGSLAASGLDRLIPGYNDVTFALNRILFQAALVLPLLRFLRRSPEGRVLSVADGFLLAFLIGFGYDLLGALLAASASQGGLPGSALLPPGELPHGKHAVAGYGYWCGIVGMALVASRRFLPGGIAAKLVTAGAIVFAALDAQAALAPAPPKLLALLTTLTFHGHLTPWLALVGLAWLSWREHTWTAAGENRTAPGSHPLLDEWQLYWRLLLARRFRDYARERERAGLRRRAEIAAAELRRAPGDPLFTKILARVDARRAELDQEEAITREGTATSGMPSPVRIAWGLLVLLVAVVPKLPDQGAFIWNFLLWPSPFPAIGLPIVSLVLLAVVIVRFIAAPPLPAGPSLERRAGRLLHLTSLAAALLVLVYGNVQDFYPWSTVQGFIAASPLPLFDPPRLTVLLLLFAAAVSLSADLPDDAPVPEARVREVRAKNILALSILVIALAASLTFFRRAQAVIHTSFGKTLFQLFGPNGNSAGDTICGILTALLCAGLSWLLAVAARRFETRWFGLGRP